MRAPEYILFCYFLNCVCVQDKFPRKKTGGRGAAAAEESDDESSDDELNLLEITRRINKVKINQQVCFFEFYFMFFIKYFIYACYRVNAMIRDLVLNNRDQAKKVRLVPLHLGASIVLARRVEKSWDHRHHHLLLAHRSVVHQTVRQ